MSLGHIIMSIVLLQFKIPILYYNIVDLFLILDQDGHYNLFGHNKDSNLSLCVSSIKL